MKIESKVGAFAAGAVIIILVAIFSVGDLSLFKKTYTVKVRFSFAGGIQKSSPVRFCGIDVGEVSRIKISRNKEKPGVIVYLRIDDKIKIPAKSLFFINSLSILGQKYVEIIPASGDSFVKNNAEINGLSATPLFLTLRSLEGNLKQLNAILADNSVRQDIKYIVDNVKNFTFSLNKLLGDVQSKQGTIGRLLYDDSLYKETESFIKEIKRNPWLLFHKRKVKNTPKKSKKTNLNF